MQRPTIAVSAVLALALSAVLAASAFAATSTVTIKDDLFAPRA